MAKSHYTADSASPPRLILAQRRSEVIGLSGLSTVCNGINGAGTPLPTPRSFIV